VKNQVDEEKLHDLLWGLLAIEWPKIEYKQPNEVEANVPFEFGAPRLLLQPRTFVAKGSYWILSEDMDPNARPDPDVFHTLSSGQRNAVEQCVDRAAQRLKSGGLLVTGYRYSRRAGGPLGIMSSISADRLLAGMLFPLSRHDIERIANGVLFPPETEESS
jgi:CRISPR-associated protein Csx17